jgi:hypothetical protein
MHGFILGMDALRDHDPVADQVKDQAQQGLVTDAS